MIDSIPPDISFQVGGSTALKTIIVAVVGALVIMTKGLGSRFVLLLFCGFIAIVLAVIVLFIVSLSLSKFFDEHIPLNASDTI